VVPLLFARVPQEQDQERAAQFLAAYGAELKAVPEADRPRVAWAAWARVLLSSNEFLYVD
jgi:hypothetical protein